MNEETENSIQELRILEQNIQSIAMQKQAFEMELSEAENALKEVEKTKDDVFRISGNIMIKCSKEEIIKELKEKKGILELRLKTLENQEKSFTQSSDEIRKKVLSDLAKKKKA